ncbi:hypothetical protein [Shewanella marina]|uniref:hypothetical protein n=1 Tax=Shewanella marina TaxID=487319 RepID=UPI0004725780|nr:hypothetical protein [Shewanella marina]
MNKLKPTTQKLDNEEMIWDESGQILTQKKRKLNNALTVLSNLVEQLQTEKDSDELDFYEEYQKLYFDIQKGIWLKLMTH